MMHDDTARINAALGRLADLLGNDFGPRIVCRAYTNAQNAAASPNASVKFTELADRLREATAIAEQLADVTKH